MLLAELSLFLQSVMKIIAFILATFMLFLAVKPGIAAISLQAAEQGCCGGSCTPSSNEKEEKQDQPENKTNQNTCNPFQACCTYVSMCEMRHFDLLARPEMPVAKIFGQYQSSFAINYSPDFWQPPRLV